MSKEDSQNCWDHIKCPKEIKESCEAYKYDMGGSCFYIHRVIERCPGFNNLGECTDCLWYSKNVYKG